MTPELTLIVKTGCPYCAKVKRFMQKRRIDIPMQNTSDPEVVKFLIEKGGKEQVPCLFIDGEPMYESDDIIAYLDKIF
ncbi:MAG: glutathione S-transferase N-terminal domain-containing protein [Coriobacteriales bacterium]|nr:glutathione S-transferase N-terminal domain-containing protein [Coriobacteriales bacterium]